MTFEEAKALSLKKRQGLETTSPAATVPTPASAPTILGADKPEAAPKMTFEQAKAASLQKRGIQTGDGSDILGKKILDLKSQGQDSSQQEAAYQSLTGKPFKVADHITNAGALEKAKSFFVGVGKGGWGTAKDLLNLSNKGLNLATSWVPGSEKTQEKLGLAGDFAIPERLTETRNKYEKAGKITENVGEFFVGGGGAKATVKAVPIVEKTLAKVAAKKTAEYAVKNSAPVMSKAERVAAIAAERGTPASLFKGAELTGTARDIKRAKVIEPVLDRSKSLFDNISNVKAEIIRKAEEVKSDAAAAKAVISPNLVKSKIRAIEKPAQLVGDAEKIYKKAEIAFMRFVDKHPGTAEGLLKARKEFDVWVEGEIPKIWEANGKPIAEALKRVRTTANNIIAEKLPNGSKFKQSLADQNLMYEAIDNMAIRAEKELGKSRVGKTVSDFAKKHPVITTAAGGAATYAGLGGVKNVIGSAFSE